MSHFDHLRSIPWYPTFRWAMTLGEAAHQINSYHEDYPKYVASTIEALRVESKTAGRIISNVSVKFVHRTIFTDKPFKGKYRDIDVKVGLHHPPTFLAITNLMNKLESLYDISNTDDLIDWYKDFETIHPFQDGNGRVGGVIVAGHAHRMHPDKGWLAPEQ